jgi:DNA-binding XRE family transcriptional regulator
LSQADLAHKLGTPKSTYVAWEREESEPSGRLFTAIHREFGSESVLTLLGEDNPTDRDSIDWEELGKIASKVDSARKKVNVYLDVEDIVEIAGAIYERSSEDRAKALDEFRMYLKIQLKHLPRERPLPRFSEAGRSRTPRQSSEKWHRERGWEGTDTDGQN